MNGYVAMSRTWQDHDIFEGDAFSRRDAWAWLIVSAAWKPTRIRTKCGPITLQRGEVAFSLRFLAEKWGWPKTRVERFVASLAAQNMVKISLEKRDTLGTLSGTLLGHSPGQPQSIITICNYEKFQAPTSNVGTHDEQKSGHLATEKRDKEEPYNQLRREEKKTVSARGAAPVYAFQGAIIRLTKHDLDQWQRAYPLVDVVARLQSRDDWLATEADERTKKRWFVATSNYLARLQQQSTESDRQAAAAPIWDGLP